MENVLRTFGLYASLGGLVLVFFLLLVRSILRNLPKPEGKNITEDGFGGIVDAYKKIIDRPILFAFILSVLALIIYAGIKVIESAQLNKENRELQEKIDQIVDPTLKTKSAAFEVLSCEVTFDLTKWQQVSPNDMRSAQISEQVTTNKRVIWRGHEEAKKFAGGTYATDSPFPPVINTFSKYNLEKIENKEEMQSGKDYNKRWHLVYDVSNAPLHEPFEIVTQTTAWNTLQNPKNHEGTLILFPTRKLTLIILFPKDKFPQPDKIIRQTMPWRTGGSASDSNEGVLTISAENSSVKWEIDRPNLAYHYLIDWQWEKSASEA